MGAPSTVQQESQRVSGEEWLLEWPGSCMWTNWVRAKEGSVTFCCSDSAKQTKSISSGSQYQCHVFVSHYRSSGPPGWFGFRLWVRSSQLHMSLMLGPADPRGRWKRFKKPGQTMKAHLKPLLRWHSLICHWHTNHIVKSSINGTWKCFAVGDPAKPHSKGCGCSFYCREGVKKK